jgi:hypothetical protein
MPSATPNLYTADARVKVPHVQGDVTLGTDAFAQALALTGGQINDPIRNPISPSTKRVGINQRVSRRGRFVPWGELFCFGRFRCACCPRARRARPARST